MPESSKAVLPNVIAGIGYALTFAACMVGIPVVLIGLGIAIAIDLCRGLATGTFRQRLAKKWW